MDSKKIIEKLIKIADNQQKIIKKLAQAAGSEDKDPMAGLPEYTGPRYDVTAPAAPKAAPARSNALLAPVGTKLTEEEWRALEKQRGMKPGESTDTVHPSWVNAPQHSQQAGTNAPATQGNPPKANMSGLSPAEKAEVDFLNRKNQTQVGK